MSCDGVGVRRADLVDAVGRDGDVGIDLALDHPRAAAVRAVGGTGHVDIGRTRVGIGVFLVNGAAATDLYTLSLTTLFRSRAAGRVAAAREQTAGAVQDRRRGADARRD